jgi:CSLREA domain-containing protein
VVGMVRVSLALRVRLVPLVIIAGLTLAAPASATNFTVNTTTDSVSNTGNPCNTPNAPNCSLRDAVIAANADALPDTIVLGATTYKLTIAGGGSPPDPSARDLDITNPVTIQGAGAGSTIVDANQIDRAFSVNYTGTTAPAVFSGLTITGGNNGGGIGDGGAIHVSGDAPVTVQSSVLSGNVATGAGGAIETYSTELVAVQDSTLSDNTALLGGAIDAEVGPLTVKNSTISGNKALNGGGGGIFNDAPFTALTITGSTISGNMATNEGGGVSTHANATVSNSTLSGNSAGTDGGGIDVGFGTSSLTNVTVAFNTAPSSTGGGLVNTNNTVTVRDSIISSNTGGDCDPSNLSASQGNNVVSDGSCAFTQPTDKPSTDPQLAPLADNGGPTQTHALPAGSPAVDAGDNSSCPANDQRGLARPFDGNFDDNAVCDAGAFELRGGPPTVATGPASAVSTSDATLSGTVNPNGVPASYHFEFGPTTAYGSGTPAASAGGGATAEPVTAAITGLAPDTLYHFRLVASGPGGIGSGADGVFTTNAVGVPGPPPPTEGVTANLTPVSGDVFVALPLSGNARASVGAAAAGALSGFGPLVKVTGPTQIPIGALVDTKLGVVQMSSATNALGGTQSGQFSKGTFIVKQARTSALTTAAMAGGNLNACSKLPHGGAAKQVAGARSRRHRSLFANVHGRFSTRGRNSSATVRGTIFLVKDTCTGTTTTVKRGTVTVRDFRLRKNVKVKAPHKYLARAPKRKHKRR